MVRHLRSGNGATGLLYGQGEFVTKHHALLVSRTPQRIAMDTNYSVQAEVDRRREAVPILVNEYQGSATIETHTVIYDRDNTPMHGIVIARTVNGERVMARVSADAIAPLLDPDKSPIGLCGKVLQADAAPLASRLLRWEF